MQIGLEICFAIDEPLDGLYKTIFEQYVKFTPTSVVQGRKVSNWNQRKHLPLLDMADSVDRLGFSAAEGSFLSTKIDRPHPYRSITLIQDLNVFLPPENEVAALIDRPGLVACYVYNEDYEYVQSTPGDYYGYRQQEISKEILASLKNTPYELEPDGSKKYKTKFNPGRSLAIDYLYLQVAWKMWFGPVFYQLVPKERILSFPHAAAINQLSDNLAFVQLYDKIEEPYTTEGVFRQWKWREWMDYDGLETKYKW